MGSQNDDPAEFETVRYETKENVAIAWLHRPESRNAINDQLSSELAAAARHFDQDQESSVLMIAGSGDDFSAGADINELQDRLTSQLDPDSTINDAIDYNPLELPSQAIDDIKKPVVALIDGYCLGGGLELALACDIRLASEQATFGTPEMTLGKFPTDGATQRLPRETSVGNAMLIVLSGEPISAKRARELGIVQQVYPVDSVEMEAIELAETIANHPTPALVLGKQVVKFARKTELQAGLDMEVLLDNFLELTPARRQKLEKFLED